MIVTQNNFEIKNGDETIDVDLQTHTVVIHERYEHLRILSDLLLGVWFLVGSVMFFYAHWTYWGTWLFVAGSVQMIIGPFIKIVQRVHLGKLMRT